jgi:tripartite-type tricarboxylate transporter receptor subunit TctC
MRIGGERSGAASTQDTQEGVPFMKVVVGRVIVAALVVACLAAAARAALAGGEVSFSASSMLAAMPLVKAGKMRAVGTTGPKRHSLTPEIPTMAEQGLAGYQIMQWWGLVSPRGTPAGVVSAINAEIGRALATPELKERLATLYAEPWPSSPQVFGAIFDQLSESGMIESVGQDQWKLTASFTDVLGLTSSLLSVDMRHSLARAKG